MNKGDTVLQARRDPGFLADSIAGSVVLAHDPSARETSVVYWERARDAHQKVLDALAKLPEPHIVRLHDRLVDDPSQVAAYRSLVVALAEWLRRNANQASRLAEIAWHADSVSRLRVHVGCQFPADVRPVGTEELRHIGLVRRASRQCPPDAAVIIPFRERDPNGHRARNLLACLHALNRQSYPRDRFRVVVIESDRRPRWCEFAGPLADTYLFAANPGPFNKSWVVNVGVVHAARAAELICILDGDIVVDESFIERNVERFERPGTQGLWPAREVLFLDPPSTGIAIRRRCLEDAPDVNTELLRGVFLRHPPGGCIWLRQELFRRVAGMDERFEGWGGEDRDFAFRIDQQGGLDRCDDTLVHLAHPRAPARPAGGQAFWAGFRWASWPPDSEIGRLDKYARLANGRPRSCS